MTAVVTFMASTTAFQAVGNHANSVFRTDAAFDDLAALDVPPKLVAVVKDKKALGTRLALLDRAGRVIDEEQPDDVYRRAAA